MLASLRRTDPVLCAILLLGLALRVWGLGYGLPHVYNPDEVSIFSRALSLGGPKGLDPGNFVYPSLFLYVLAASVGTLYGVERIAGRVSSLSDFTRTFWQDPTAAYLVGRSVSVAAGVATIAATYFLARRIADRATARIAALLMAVAYFPVRDSHMIKHDVAVAFAAAVVVLAAWKLRARGRDRDYAVAGGLAGMSLALHYYAGLLVIPVAVAQAQRAGGIGAAFWRHRGPWIAALLFVATFALLSPYVLIDFRTAVADITSNDQVLFARTQAIYPYFDAGLQQAYLMATQGAGVFMTLAALAGVVLIARSLSRDAALLLAFPFALSLMLLHTWPYGRLQNALYPFAAVTAGFAIVRAGRRTARPSIAVVALTAVCAAQPLFYDIVLDRLFTRVDTRTEAADWIASHVPAGAGIAIDVYSVPIEPTANWLRETIAQHAPGEPIGSRDAGLLARNPYPSNAYRLFYLGVGGLDKDKAYIDPAAAFGSDGLRTFLENHVSYVVIKEKLPHEADQERRALSAGATLVHRLSPFADDATPGFAQLPDYDVTPSLAVTQPGPTIEVWRLREGGHDH